MARGLVPALLGIHSFTPCFQGRSRPWQVGVLWDEDPRLARPLIEALRAENLVVGDNEPYDGALIGDSMYEHSTRRGLPGALIEIRQDLLADAGAMRGLGRASVRAHPAADPARARTRCAWNISARAPTRRAGSSRPLDARAALVQFRGPISQTSTGGQ